VGTPDDQDGRAAPFAAHVILNGHEYVAIAAQGEGTDFANEGSC
jgi:hypothetical protein